MAESAQSPNDEMQALQQGAAAAFERSDWAEAERALRRCLEIVPGHAGTLFNLGLIAYRKGAANDAEGFLRAAINAGGPVEALLILGEILAASNRLAKAARVFEQYLTAVPTHTAAMMALADVKVRQGEPASARAWYGRAHAALPKDLGIAKKYAEHLFEEDPARSVAILEGLLADTTSPRQRVAVLETLIGQKEWYERIRRGEMPYHCARRDELFFNYARPYVDEYEAASRALLEAKPDDTGAVLARGWARFCLEDRHGAEALFQSVRQETVGHILEAVTFEPAFYDRLRTFSQADITRGLPELIAVTPPIPDPKGVLYLSCNYFYFAAFAMPMLWSLKERSPGTAVHVHIMDASEDETKIALGFCRALAPLSFAISVERPGLTNAPTMKARCYYHAVRFIRFYQHLRQYNCPLWLMDVDAVVNRGLGALFEKLEDIDVAMRIRPGRLEPWNQFNACVVGASIRRTSVEYFRLIAAYIADFHQRDGLRWGIDQLAMYGVFADMEDRGEAPSLCLLGDHDVDYDYNDDGFVWCNSGVKKFRHLERVRSGEVSQTGGETNRFVTVFEGHWQKTQNTLNGLQLRR